MVIRGYSGYWWILVDTGDNLDTIGTVDTGNN